MERSWNSTPSSSWRRLEAAGGGRQRRAHHFLQLRVLTDEGLRVDGLRVHYKLLLYPPDAALGCAVEVPTLDGPVTLQVPPGSSVDVCCDCAGVVWHWTIAAAISSLRLWWSFQPTLAMQRALYRRLQELALEAEDG